MPTDLQLSISVHDDVPPEKACIVDKGLGQSNDRAAPLHEVCLLSCFARVPTGAIIGGAIGRTWGVCCELQQLWVEPEHRRQGIAERLLNRFHQRAQARGCRTFYLETFSFQAPSLYRALGYRVELELSGFSPGISKYTMVRHAEDTEAGALNLSAVDIKAFVPARDFELSKLFYEAIGFKIAWSSEELALFRYGSCSFLLQDFYLKQHAENFVMHLLVDDVDHWHEHAVAQGVAKRFGVRLGMPEDRPWAARDFTLFDPSGVLWRIGQNIRRPESKKKAAR